MEKGHTATATDRQPGVRQSRAGLDVVFVAIIVALTLFLQAEGSSRWFSDVLVAPQRVGEPPAAEIEGPFSTYRLLRSCLPGSGSDSCTINARLVFDQPGFQEAGDLSILIPRHSGHLSVKVNGRSTRIEDQQTQRFRLIHRPPALIPLADGLIQPGANVIEIELTSRTVLGGFIDTVEVGPSDDVQEKADRLVTWAYGLPRMVDGALVILTLFAAYIGLRHGDRIFILFSIVASSILISTVSQLLLGATSDHVSQALGLTRFFGGALILPLLSGLSDIRSPLSVRALMSLPAAVFLNWALSENNHETMVAVRMFWFIALVLLGMGVGITIIGMVRRRSASHVIVIVAGVFGVCASSMNFLHTIGMPIPIAAVLRGYSSTGFILIVSVELIQRFSKSLAAVRLANAAMQDEIGRVTASLTASHLRAEEARRELTIQRERQRIMGDLHDGIAGNLISIRAMAEQSDESALPQIETLARSALLDLRLVVDSLDSFEGDLAAAIAAFRERIAPQFPSGELRLLWDIERAPVLPELLPETNLALFRILQEAIANARRHGNADTVSVVVRPARKRDQTARIFVIDNGRPCRTSPVLPGFGLRNMRRRATAIRSTLRFRFSDRGGVVLLCLGDIPLRGGARPAKNETMQEMAT